MNPTPTQPSLLDHTLERLILIRTTLIPKQHSIRLNDKLGFVIKDCNVAIEANGDFALEVFETDLFGGVGAAPKDDVFDGDVAGGGFGPEDADAEAYAADATPGGEEVAFALFAESLDSAGYIRRQ
jgi:hypothetical protein